MGERLRQRGPDGAGDWIDPALGTALTFRRLAIIDLSDQGRQPMLSADGRWVLAINGEIYNYRALRAELAGKGSRFRGSSDTEVLLAGISTWGLEETLHRSVGMFALALVDIAERRLFLARDRLGEKPLYYGWSGNHFFFGSELKAFRPHPRFVPEIDRGALTLYLRYGYVPSPHCILNGLHKLLPGHILSLALDGNASRGKETTRAYWTLPRPGQMTPFKGSPEDCVSGLEELLSGAIRMQTLADVPVGAFLSGGIDSSTIVALMQAQASTPVRTFSIGFPDAQFDESLHAEKIAAHLGTQHETWLCDDSEMLGLVKQVPAAYSEPFADDSQVPTMALARMARRQVTVSLSGDGGDELCHGYWRYEKSVQRWNEIQDHPGISLSARCGINTLSSLVGLLAECPIKRRWLGRLGRARDQWLPKHLPAFYRQRISVNKEPALYLSRPEAARDFFDDAGDMTGLKNESTLLSYLDLKTYLPEDILVKVDRAAMAFSLETRIPLLDHRIVEYAARIPVSLKVNGGATKWPLRQILSRYVPRKLTDRPKMGFMPPTDRWLLGPLREWAEELLAEDRVRREGFFEPRELNRLWNEQKSRKRDRAYLLWGILMFQAWHESF